MSRRVGKSNPGTGEFLSHRIDQVSSTKQKDLGTVTVLDKSEKDRESSSGDGSKSRIVRC